MGSNPWAHYTILHIKLFISTFARRCMAISGTSTGGSVPYKDMWSHILVVYRLHTGFFKITAILSNSWRRNLHAPFPPIQCCYIALLGKVFKKKQPFRFGCRHALGNNIDQGGAWGAGVMWPHAGGLLFFSRTPEKFCWFMDVQTQAWTNSLCTCQTLNLK